jgi:methyl-accepting chemotaxis protein
MRAMKNWTMGPKLMTGAAALVVLSAVLGIAWVNSIGKLRDAFDQAADKTAKKVYMAGLLDSTTAQLYRTSRGVVFYTLAKRPASAENNRKTFRSTLDQMQKVIQDYSASASSGTQAKLAEVRTELTGWTGQFEEIARLCASGRAKDTKAAMDISEASQAHVNAIGKSTEGLVQHEQEVLAANKQAAASEVTYGRTLAFGLLGLSLLIGLAVFWLVRSITRVIRDAVAAMAEGAGQVASAAGQVSSASQSLAQGTSQQAASLEETSASTEEINSMTRKNAESSRSAADSMAETAQRIAEANQNLEQMMISMKEINTSSDKISKIIKVIDEIAFQTNILALNAAVEAARAGEAGMGFAVVADEVRNLAQRCAQAARDTSSLIAESIAKSNEGKVKLDQVAEVIQGVTAGSSQVKTLVDEVSVGSQEQSRGIEQIAKAISQMEQVTQNAAASAEESAAAGEELSAQSQTLNEIVGNLSALVGRGDNESWRKAPNPRRATERPVTVRRTSAPAAAQKVEREARPHTPANGHREYMPAPVGAGSGKHPAFPLDDDFKEF